MDIHDRIRRIIDDKFNGNVSSFCRYTGIKQSTMNTIIGERKSKPSYDVLVSIVSANSLNVSPEWLLTGKGDRYISDKLADIDTSSPQTIDFSSISEGRSPEASVAHDQNNESYVDLVKTNIFLSNQVRRLTEELEAARDRIDYLNYKLNDNEAKQRKA